MSFPELVDLRRWAVASPARHDDIARRVAASLPGFEVAEVCAYTDVRIATLRDRASGVLFQLIPGGTFEMGFSRVEERALRALVGEEDQEDEEGAVARLLAEVDRLRPVHRVRVGPLLLARRPLEVAEAERVIDLDRSRVRMERPAALYPGELRALQKATGHRLPSEAEWEYACRAGGRSLFPWGNRMPGPEDWLGEDAGDEAVRSAAARQRFGLVDLGARAEACADAWHPSYQGAPSDGRAWAGSARARVVRGGAANLFPWQDCGEWLLMLSANRTRSTDWEFGLNVRLARSVPGYS